MTHLMETLINGHTRATARLAELQDRLEDPEAGGSTLENAIMIGGLAALAIGLVAVVTTAVDSHSGNIR